MMRESDKLSPAENIVIIFVFISVKDAKIILIMIKWTNVKHDNLF